MRSDMDFKEPGGKKTVSVVRRLRATEEIERLERTIDKWQQQIGTLVEQHHVLHAKACAAHIAVEQCLALLHLGAVLQQGALRASGCSHHCGLSPDSAASITINGANLQHPSPPASLPAWQASLPDWQAHLEQMVEELELSCSGAAAQVPPCSSRLGWDPAAAAELALGANLTTSGLRRAIRDFTRLAGPLYMKARPGSGYSDTEQARRRLEAERARLLQFAALLFTCGDPSPASQVLLTSMDEDGPAPPRPPPSSPSWFQWLVEQLQLEPEQEALLIAALHSLKERQAPVQEQRARLVQECSEDAKVLDEVVAQISAGLHTYQVISGVYMLAVYGTILRADQFARYLLAAWPYMPSLSGLREALEDMRARRQGASGSKPGAGGAAQQQPGHEGGNLTCFKFRRVPE